MSQKKKSLQKPQKKPGTRAKPRPGKATTPIRVLVAEPHTLIRAGLRTLLAQAADIKVVGETGQSRLLAAAVQMRQPQVVLFGVGMGGNDWLAQVAKINKEFPSVKFVVLSTHHGEEYITHLLRAGISGFLLEEAALKELKEAFKLVIGGGTYLCRLIDNQAMKNRLKRAKGSAGARAALTLRQRQILELIAEGKTTKETAFQLKLSSKTVETHRAHMMERLNIYNVPGLVRYAMRMGLISMDS